MNERAEAFFRGLGGATVALCGLGGSHLPLIRLFSRYGARILACDKRPWDALGEETRAALRETGAQTCLGEGYLDRLREAQWIFRTPGMPYRLPQLDAARARGAAVTSEMEVFFDLCPCPIYAVTGSDGKTTTTTLLAEFWKAAGRTVHLGGNIGKPLLPEISSVAPGDVAVVELSSFQLISMRRGPQVAVVTNLSPNHLDVHKDMDEYVNAKRNLVLHQGARSRAVLNADNALAASFAPDVRGQLRWFSRRERSEYGAWLRDDGMILVGDTECFPASDIRIPGLHNVENVLAAVSAVWGDIPLPVLARVAREFPGVPHRMELVRELGGVKYYNDSIGTSPTRTIRGTLSLYGGNLLLIAGGYDKKIPFDGLGRAVAGNVRVLILLGATSQKIEDAVKAAPAYRAGSPEIVRVSSMEEAVQAAYERARPGDVVSLSPACASFDLYPNFAARGDHFRALVQALPEP